MFKLAVLPQSAVEADAWEAPFTYRFAVIPSNVPRTWYQPPPVVRAVVETRFPTLSDLASNSIFPSERIQTRHDWVKSIFPTIPAPLAGNVSGLTHAETVNAAEAFRDEDAATVIVSATPSKSRALPSLPAIVVVPVAFPWFPFPDKSSK